MYPSTCVPIQHNAFVIAPEECLNLLHSDISRVTGDGTGVLAVSQADVAGLTPGSAPGVADLPVTVGGSVHADGLHAVVHSLATSCHDTSLVRVPTRCVNAHGERTRGLHVRGHRGLTLERRVACDTNHEVVFVGFAGSTGTLGGGVRIGGLGLDAASLLDVVVSSLSPAALASVRNSVTLYHLLRRKDVGSLQGAHGVGLDLLDS